MALEIASIFRRWPQELIVPLRATPLNSVAIVISVSRESSQSKFSWGVRLEWALQSSLSTRRTQRCPGEQRQAHEKTIGFHQPGEFLLQWVWVSQPSTVGSRKKLNDAERQRMRNRQGWDPESGKYFFPLESRGIYLLSLPSSQPLLLIAG